MNSWKEWNEPSLLSNQRGILITMSSELRALLVIRNEYEVLTGNKTFTRLIYSSLHSIISLLTYLGHLLLS